jgi:hypothetical protein
LVIVPSLMPNASASGAASEGPASAAKQPAARQPSPPPPNLELVRLAKDYDVWIDTQHKLLVVGGEVVFREGMLEMFACPKGTKEHESIVAINCKAQFVHAGLLAVGAVTGHPVRFHPEYAPATGTTIDIWIRWEDAQGKKQEMRAQEWVKNLSTGKPLEYDWVFAGSGFWTDESTGQKFYFGDSGDFICVSNFPSATLDLPIKSSDANSELAYGAFTERIPPLGTKVRLVLVPRLERKEKPTEKAAGSTPAAGDAKEKVPGKG